MSRNIEVINQQQRILRDLLGPVLAGVTEYAVVDFPDYSNVGDSAIWLGQIQLLKELTGKSPAYISRVENFNLDELTAKVKTGPVLITGGGNFGDIWRKHQDFREYLMTACKGRRLIQLPQSLKFNHQESVAHCAELIRQHGDFHLFVRDHSSFELAKSSFSCHIELSPDCAFGIGPLKRLGKPEADIFMLMRTDTERADYDRTPFLQVDAISEDWLKDTSYFYTKHKLIASLNAFAQGRLKPTRLDYYQALAKGRLMRGVRMLSRGKRVVTDRLHAHIISTLLDIPHVALDNNYGKVSGYINAWTHPYSQVKVANSAQDAIEKLDSLDPI